MGKLQQAQDVEAGNALLEELRSYGSSMDGIVDDIVQLAMNYDAFRAGLEGDDVTYADASLQTAITDNKPKIDALSPGQQSWVDFVMAGLGYSKTV